MILIADYPFFQIIILIHFSLFNLIYLVMVKPFDTDKNNILEVFNEICIITVAYIFILFTDHYDDPNLVSNIGWTLVSIAIL